MTQNKLNKVYAPEYVTKFACIGSACEDTCCAGWRVDIDRKTYKKYRDVDNPELKQLLDENIKRNRNNPSNGNYAYIQLRSDGACPLLTEDRLCRIHKELGESFLSTTCAVYPRKMNMVLGMLEQTLTMSCPEAARLALLNPEKMSYAEIPVKPRTTFQVSKNIVAKDSNRIEYYFANLRLFTIELLQNRDYSISDRLIVVGLAMRKVQECVDSERLTDIPRVLNSYAEAVNSGTLKASLQAIPSNLTIQIKLMKAIADRRLIQGVASLRYRECYAEFLKGLNFTPEATDEEIANQYRQAYENYFEPFLKEHEYIFENYLVNSALRETFPLTDTLSVYESYISLVLPFAWMKLVLVGMAGYQRSQFGVESVLKLIQSYTKVVEHNAQFKKEVINILKQEGYDSMPYMSILLRN